MGSNRISGIDRIERRILFIFNLFTAVQPFPLLFNLFHCCSTFFTAVQPFHCCSTFFTAVQPLSLLFNLFHCCATLFTSGVTVVECKHKKDNSNVKDYFQLSIWTGLNNPNRLFKLDVIAIGILLLCNIDRLYL